MLRRSIFAALAAASAAALLAVPAVSAPAAPAFSPAELSVAKSTLDARLAQAPSGVTTWGVDPATKRVTVSVLQGDAAALATAQHATAGLSAAKIITVTEKVRPLYNLVGGQAIYSSGGGRCSIGFSGTKGSARYVITAGHCTRLGGTWSGFNRVSIGPVATSAYPTDDFGTLTVTNTGNWVNTAVVAVANNASTTVPVYGSTAAGIGTAVCRSGSTTGWRCGNIQATNQTVNYGSGNIIYGLTRTNACAEPGDSGGSYLTTSAGTGGQAQGVLSGGSGNCTSGGTTFFQPLPEILQRTGISLSTTAPTVTLCKDINYTGTCNSYTADVPNLGVFADRNDVLSSVRVAPYRYLLLYADINYTGTCQSFAADKSDLRGTTVGNDTVSSFRIATSVPSTCPA